MRSFGQQVKVRAVRLLILTAVVLVIASSSVSPILAQARPVGPGGLLDDLFLLKNRKTARISSYDKSGGNSDWLDIKPGETKTLAEFTGAGVIRRFYMAPFAIDRMRYRKLIMRVYWDGATDPCIEVPIGDFFGSGLGTLRYFQSLVVNVNRGQSGWDFDGFVNYFPMPFEKGAKITLENDGNVEQFRIWYHFDYEQYPLGVLPANSGRLHAQWRRVAHPTVKEGVPKNTTLGANNVKNPTGEDNFLVLDAEGQGSYVGLFLTVDNVKGEWYGEGDDMIFVDGAKSPPTYSGTGHEEIFNAGCCPDVEYWGPYTGFYLIENYRGDFGGKNQMYRFYINDPVRFRKSVRVTIERGHANNYENDYTSTAFWYQKDPHKHFPSMPSAQERLPQWPEEVSAAIEKETKLQNEIQALTRAGKFRPNDEDRKSLQTVREGLFISFRELRFQDFIKHLEAMEGIVNRYKSANP